MDGQLAAKLVARNGRAVAVAAALFLLLLKPMAGHDSQQLHGHTLSFMYSRNVSTVK